VQTSLPGVAKEAERCPVPMDDFLEAARIGAQLLRRDTGVLDEFLRLDVSRRRSPVEQPSRHLAQRPRGGLIFRLEVNSGDRSAGQRRSPPGEIVRQL
jgi:hypothetical protein